MNYELCLLAVCWQEKSREINKKKDKRSAVVRDDGVSGSGTEIT
jgi:hypothetical protein